MPFLAETERKFGIKYDMRQTEELMPMSKKGSQIAELEKAMLSVYMKQKPPTEKEARSAYTMFQKHRKHIETYEHTFSSQFSEKKYCITKAPDSGGFFCINYATVSTCSAGASAQGPPLVTTTTASRKTRSPPII